MAKPVYNVDLSAHLAECELNFVRLCRLLPRMEAGDERVFGLGEGLQVRIAVSERTPYTSLLQIGQEHAALADLNNEMTVRVYHDAGVAEVASFAGCYWGKTTTPIAVCTSALKSSSGTAFSVNGCNIAWNKGEVWAILPLC